MENQLHNADVACAPSDVQEYTFTLKVRVERPHDLRMAAAACLSEDSEDDIIELLGPIQDPSLKDCLMALLLPQRTAGYTMREVSID